MTPAQTDLKPRASKFKRFVRRIWKPFLIVVVVLVAIHGIATMILGRRFEAEMRTLKAQGEPLSDADFKIPPIPDSHNGAVIYNRALNLLNESKHRGIDMTHFMDVSRYERQVEKGESNIKPVNWTEADAANQTFKVIIPLLKDALCRPNSRIYENRVSQRLYMPVVNWPLTRDLVKTLSIMATIDARCGRRDAAYREGELAVRVSEISQNSPTVIQVLVKTACVKMANSSVRSLLSDCSLTSAQEMELNRYLLGSDLYDEMAPALAYERATTLSFFAGPSKGGLLASISQPAYDDESTKAPWWTKHFTIKQINYAAAPLLYLDGVAYMHTMDKLISVIRRSGNRWTHDAGILNELIDSIPKYAVITRFNMPIDIAVCKVVIRQRADTALTQILLAAKRYKQRTGQYPESMAQVRSVGLAGIPMDPFSGKDFIYKRTPKGFLAYSIGTDLKDDGGVPVRSGADFDKGGDIVLNWEL